MCPKKEQKVGGRIRGKIHTDPAMYETKCINQKNRKYFSTDTSSPGDQLLRPLGDHHWRAAFPALFSVTLADFISLCATANHGIRLRLAVIFELSEASIDKTTAQV